MGNCICFSNKKKEIPKETLKEIIKDAPRELPKDTQRVLQRELPKDMLKDTQKEPLKDTLKDTPKEPLKDTLNDQDIIKNDIIKNINNIIYLKNKYVNEFEGLFDVKKLKNYLNMRDCYFLLIFPQTRDVLFSNNNYREILCLTNDGIEYLADRYEYKLLLKTKRGIDIIYKRKLYDYFDNSIKLYFLVMECNSDLLDDKLVLYVIENIVNNKSFYFDESECKVHTIVNPTEKNGYNDDGYLIKPVRDYCVISVYKSHFDIIDFDIDIFKK
jgi:hypothetical protein